jgi:hypothetical protein
LFCLCGFYIFWGNYMKNILFYPLPFLAVLLLYLSCAASGPAVQKAPGEGEALVPVRVVSLEESFDGVYWVTRPRDAAITIMGIAGRRGSRAESIREALADAARKAALYHGVHAESAAVLNQGSENLDYFSDFDYRINPLNSHETYIDALVFDEDKDILEKNGAVILRTRYSGVSDVRPTNPPLKGVFPPGLKTIPPASPVSWPVWGIHGTRGPFKKPIRLPTKPRLSRFCHCC